VKKTFPYLVEKEFATGGGDVPEFKWHFIKENVEFELECGGFRITPVAGTVIRYFITLETH